MRIWLTFAAGEGEVGKEVQRSQIPAVRGLLSRVVVKVVRGVQDDLPISVLRRWIREIQLALWNPVEPKAYLSLCPLGCASLAPDVIESDEVPTPFTQPLLKDSLFLATIDCQEP